MNKEDDKLIENFFKTQTEADKIMLKFQEWDDFKKMPQRNLAKADEESWEMLCKIVKMIKKYLASHQIRKGENDEV